MGSVISVHCGSRFRETPGFLWIYYVVCCLCNVETSQKNTSLKFFSPYSLTIGECDQCTLWIHFERDPRILVNILCVVQAILRPSKNHFLKIAQPLRKMPCNFLVPSKNISPKLFGPWKINVSGHWPEGNVINVHPGSNFRGVPRFWWIYHMVCSMSNVEFLFTALGVFASWKI